MVREGRVFISPTPGKPEYGVGYYVTAYEVGAQVASASSGTTADVRAGHGFNVNDKMIVGTDVTQYRRVTAKTATTLTFDSAISLAEGDLLVNLAADTGTTEPNFDGTGLTVYTDMDYSNVAVNNTVLTDQYGKYRYYHIEPTWELVRNGSTPIALYTETGPGYARSESNDGVGVYMHPIGQHDAFPDVFGASSSPGVGFTINKSSTNALAPGLFFMHDGIPRWAYGEDYKAGDRSYFGWWGDKTYPGTGDWTSGDFVCHSWGGAETSLPGNTPRLAGQPGVDGPKVLWNGSFVPSLDPDTYSSPFQYTFMCPTLQTGTSDEGIWAAIFHTALYGTGVPVDFPSGGLQVNVSSVGRPGLKIINLSATADQRTAYMSGGKSGVTTNGYSWGVDIAGVDTQNWSIIDHVGSVPRLYINEDGDIGFNTSSGTQFITGVRTQNAESLLQIENSNTGNGAATGAVFSSHPAGNYLQLRCYGSGVATYGGHSAVYAGSGSKLYVGANNALQHYFDATAPGTFVMAAATTAGASIRLAHGTAPTSPVNGDMWTTTAGLYVRINGATVGPLS